jgi:acyl-CoA thioesterase-1
MSTSRLPARRRPVLALLLAALLVPIHAGAAMRTVVVFGDSIAAGTGLPEHERDRVWVRRVADLAGGRLEVVNEGKGGRWTRARGEFNAMLARQAHADVLVIALGTNDSADLSDGAVVRMLTNVAYMVQKARLRYGPGLRVLLLAPPDLRIDALRNRAIPGDRRATRLHELDLGLAALARRLDCEFLSLRGVVPPASLASDGMHPDAAGNERIARTVLPVLLQLAEPAAR